MRRSRGSFVIAATVALSACGSFGANEVKATGDASADAGHTDAAATTDAAAEIITDPFEARPQSNGWLAAGNVTWDAGAVTMKGDDMAPAFLERTITLRRRLSCEADLTIATVAGETSYLGITLVPKNQGPYEYWITEARRVNDRIAVLTDSRVDLIDRFEVIESVTTIAPGRARMRLDISVEDSAAGAPSASVAFGDASAKSAKVPTPMRPLTFALSIGILAATAAETLVVDHVSCAID